MQLPCAGSGAEDGVCMALAQLSKELLDTNMSGAQTGGCDSSDCLFCQYRSNSPFHLNAYAGKLNSLLRKRSLNGMALSSLNSFIDSSSEQGAALLAAATAALGSNGKRQRAVSTSGAPASLPLQFAAPGSASSLTVGVVADHTRPVAIDHDYGVHCSITVDPSIPGVDAGEVTTLLVNSEPANAVNAEYAAREADATRQESLPDLGHQTGRSTAGNPSGGSDDLPETNAVVERPEVAVQASPGPSSLLLRSQSHGLLQPQPQRPDRHPHQSASHQKPQPRLLSGQPLPNGWSFQPDWERRPGPAPAELVQVLSLPDTASGCRTGCGDSRTAAASGLGPNHGSAGIVCALEFSPDGRLLAAGGVDKQIRLYNLSEAFGDMYDNDEDELLCEDREDEEEGMLLSRVHRRRGVVDASPLIAAGRGGAAGVGGGGRRCGRRRRRCQGDDGDSGAEEDDEDERGRCSLLAGVQRMPSKISSMAWSPHMEGMLTVGDYDGVILQLHIASGHQVADVDAHGGRKIWSVAHSDRIPHLVASAADDRCARLWAGRGLSHCVAKLQPNPRASVCSVDFSPGQDHLLALACSDSMAYLYDMRSLGGGPMATLRYHTRPVSYCRFMGPDQLVTAATDASLALWNLRGAEPVLAGTMVAKGIAASKTVQPPQSQYLAMQPPIVSPFQVTQAYDPALVRPQCQESVSAPGAGQGLVGIAGLSDTAGGGPAAPPSVQAHGDGTGGLCHDAPAEPRRVFRGHRNEKNFVGLSVRAADRLLACGSECSRAFAYHTSWSDPLATMTLPGSVTAAASAPPAPALPIRQPQCRQSSGGWSGAGGAGGFVSAVCWQPSEAAAALSLPPLLASATSLGSVSLSVLAARS